MDASPPRSARLATLALIGLILTAPPWGANVTGVGEPASGSLDLLKLGVLIVAAVIAFSVRVRTAPGLVAGAFTGYAVVAAIGGQLAGLTLTGDAVRSLRYAIVCIAAAWVSQRLGMRRVLATIAATTTALAALSLVSWLGGLNPLIDGRLAAFLPAQHPNSLAANSLVGLACIVMLLMMKATRTLLAVAACALLISVIVLSGSRTALVGVLVLLLVAGVLAVVKLRSITGLMTTLGGVIAALLFIAFEANTGGRIWASLATRGGVATTFGTVDVRAVAWDAVVARLDGTIAQWFGLGLSTKAIDTTTAYVTVQTIDGSIFAAYASAGLIGAALLALGVVAALFAARGKAVAALVVLVPVVVGAWSESYLADVSVTLVVFVAVATASVETRRSGDDYLALRMMKRPIAYPAQRIPATQKPSTS